MTFTDDDLKWLKEISPSSEEYPDFGIKRDMILALLARLEASERVIKEMEYMTCAGYNTTTRGLIWDAIKAWRQAAGK